MRRRAPRALRAGKTCAVVASALLAWLPVLAGLSVLAGVPHPHGGWLAGVEGVLGLPFAALPLVSFVLALAPIAQLAVPFQRRVWRLNGIDVVLAALLVVVPGPGLWVASVVASIGLGVAAPHLGGRLGGRPVGHVAASLLLAAGAGSAVALGVRAAAHSPVAAAALGALVAALARQVLAGWSVAVIARRSPWSQIVRPMPPVLLHAAGNGSVGVLAIWLCNHAPLGLAGLVLPAVLVASSAAQQERRGAETRLFTELAFAGQRAAGATVDESVAVVLTVAARVLGGADVELLLSGRDGLVRYRGDEVGVASRERVDPRVLDAPTVLRLLAGRHVRVGHDEGRAVCAFAVGSGSPPRAVVIARRPHGAPDFSPRVAVLAGALAEQAEPWLCDEGRQGGAGPADPRVDAVREAALRLAAAADPSRRAAGPGGRPGTGGDLVSGLLEELYDLEHSVASLLGSTGTSPQPAGEAETVAALLPRQRVATDWTTTGRLG